jgi:hypothetical protein
MITNAGTIMSRTRPAVRLSLIQAQRTTWSGSVKIEHNGGSRVAVGRA